MEFHSPDTGDVLEELAEEVLSVIDRRALGSFRHALISMVEYHAFLLKSYSFVTDEGQLASHANLGKGFLDLGQGPNWSRHYRFIVERSTNLLERDPGFFSTVGHIPLLLLDRCGLEVPADAVAQTAIVTLSAFHRLEDWWSDRAEKKSGFLPSVRAPYVLVGMDARIHRRAIRELIGDWDSLLTSTLSLHRINRSRGPDDDLWNRTALAWPLVARHLTGAAYLAGAAAQNGDEYSANLLVDAFLVWREDIARFIEPDTLFGGHDLNTDLFQSSLAFARDATSVEAFEPVRAHALVNRILANAWYDIRLGLAAVLLAWNAKSGGSRLAQDLARRLFFGRILDADLADHGPVEALDYSRILRSCLRTTLAEANGYRAWLDSAVSRIDEMTEDDKIPGRIYTPKSIHRYSDVSPYILVLAAASINPVADAISVDAAEVFARELDDSDVDRLLSRLIELRDSVSTAALDKLADSIAVVRGDAPNLAHTTSRRDILALDLSRRIEALQSRWRTRILSAPLTEMKRISAEIEAGTFSAPPAIVRSFIEYEVVEYNVVSSALPSAECTIGKFQRIGLTNLPEATSLRPSAGHLSSQFRSYISNSVLRSLRAETGMVVIPASNTSWLSISVEAERILRDGQQPILIVPDHAGPIWLRAWIEGTQNDRYPVPTDLPVERFSEDEWRIALLGRISIVKSDAHHRYLLLTARERLRRFLLARFSDNFILDATWLPEADQLSGSIRLRWAQAVEYASARTVQFDF